MQGTWKTTGGSGPDFTGLIQVAVIAGVAIGAAVIVVELAWLIISVAVVAIAARLWLLYRRNVALADMADAFVREHAIRAAEAVKAAAEQRAHEIEVARAGAQPVQIINVIDPAPARCRFRRGRAAVPGPGHPRGGGPVSASRPDPAGGRDEQVGRLVRHYLAELDAHRDRDPDSARQARARFVAANRNATPDERRRFARQAIPLFRDRGPRGRSR